MPATVSTDELIENSLFDLIGLANAPRDRKDKITTTIMETVENRVLSRILDRLTKDETAEFEKSVDGGQDSVRAFLESHDLNVATMTSEEVILYKAELVEMVTGATLQTV